MRPVESHGHKGKGKWSTKQEQFQECRATDLLNFHLFFVRNWRGQNKNSVKPDVSSSEGSYNNNHEDVKQTATSFEESSWEKYHKEAH